MSKLRKNSSTQPIIEMVISIASTIETIGLNLVMDICKACSSSARSMDQLVV